MYLTFKIFHTLNFRKSVNITAKILSWSLLFIFCYVMILWNLYYDRNFETDSRRKSKKTCLNLSRESLVRLNSHKNYNNLFREYLTNIINMSLPDRASIFLPILLLRTLQRFCYFCIQNYVNWSAEAGTICICSYNSESFHWEIFRLIWCGMIPSAAKKRLKIVWKTNLV